MGMRQNFFIRRMIYSFNTNNLFRYLGIMLMGMLNEL
jgi:hypothetical protein